MSKTDFCVEIHVVNGLYIDITGTTRHRKRLFFKGWGYKSTRTSWFFCLFLQRCTSHVHARTYYC